MKMTIDVRNRDEGDAIRLALDDPELKASVVVIGLLLQLPDDAARARVLARVGTLRLAWNGHSSSGLRLHDADSSE